MGPITPTGALRAWYSVGIVLFTAVAVLIGCVLYTKHQQEQADQRWCAMLALQATASPPPATPRGASIQSEAERLSAAFGCPEEIR